jgi:UrcA family protein
MLIELLALAAAAAAENDKQIIVDAAPTFHIQLADYDLSRDEGIRSLKRRINWAANKVCKRQFSGSVNIEVMLCARSAIADARVQLDRQLARRKAGEPQVASVAISFPGK